MKYQLLSLLLPVLASAAAFESENQADPIDEIIPEDSGVEYLDDYVIPENEKWDIIASNVSELPTADNVGLDQSSLGWSIMSYFGSFITSSSPLKQSTSAGTISAEIRTSESELQQLAELMNCDVDELPKLESSVMKKLVSLRKMSKVAILTSIAETGQKSIFELFVIKNLSMILFETSCYREFRSIVFSCIKINSEIAFLKFMDEPKFPLNAPQAIVLSSIHGSKEILKFVIDKQESPEYTWEWASFDGSDGYMRDFGVNPLDAALFLGSYKAISGGHLECLQILKDKGVNIAFKDFLLLKMSAEHSDSAAYKILSATATIHDSVVNEVLLAAINAKNESLAEHLIGRSNLNYSVESHLIPAINSQNKRIFDLILLPVEHYFISSLSKIKPDLNSHVLNIAASAGNTDIFIKLIKISSVDLVLPALVNCISNTSFQHYVPHIVENVDLTTEMINQGLVHSVKVRSSSLVKLFLDYDGCTAKLVHKPFLGALMSNDPELFDPFFAKFNAIDIIVPSQIPQTSFTLIELKAWKTLKVYVEKYIDSVHFRKPKFLSLILKTDQVELAKFVVQKGGRIVPTELNEASNRDMHEFAVRTIGEDLTKSQMRKRK